MSSKRKPLPLSDSDNSSDAGSDSELLNIGKKKRARSPSSGSDHGGRSSSPSPVKKRKTSSTANGNAAAPPSTQQRPGSDSDTSDSDSDWGASTTNKKKKKPLPKTRKRRISQEGSDSEPEEGELSDSGSEGSRRGGGSSSGGEGGGGGQGGSDDEEEDDEEEFDDGLDDNLIGDEADRARLEKMTEKEREQEIYNRIEKREVLKTRFDIEKKLRLAKKQEQRKKRGDKDPEAKSKDKDKDKENKSNAIIVTSDRKKTLEENKAGRSEKFAALKAKREVKKAVEEKEKEKKEAEESKKDKDDDDGSGSDASERRAKQKLNPSQVFSSDEDSDHSTGKSAAPQKPFVRSRSNSSSSSSSSDSDSNKSAASGGSGSSGPRRRRGEEERASIVASRSDLERIRLSRHKMSLYVHLPIFAKAIIGCFVRVGIGQNMSSGAPVYRVAEIIEVCETAKVYALEKTKTNKGLRLRHGKQERVYRLEFISNREFSDSEYNKWVESCASHDVPLPSMETLAKKEKDIKDLLNYNYTNDDIDTIVNERLRFTNRPTNYAVAKTELLKKRDIAKQSGNQEELEKVNEQIAELDTTSTRLDKRRTATISSILYINERNRKDNVIKAEKAILAEVEALKGVRASDPFTRRQTRPCIVTKDVRMSDEPSDQQQQLQEERKLKADKEARKKEEDAQKKKIEEERAKEEERKRIQEEDLYAAHDFDLNIDFGPAMPSVATPPVPGRVGGATNGGGPTPKRSLNLEEYKKKKGLL